MDQILSKSVYGNQVLWNQDYWKAKFYMESRFIVVFKCQTFIYHVGLAFSSMVSCSLLSRGGLVLVGCRVADSPADSPRACQPAGVAAVTAAASASSSVFHVPSSVARPRGGGGGNDPAGA